MASYLENSPSPFAPIPLYQPDFNFLSKVYAVGQARYDKGFNMVRSFYNSMLNGAVTNGDNEMFRNEVYKKVQGAIKGLAAVDLSNPTNVMYAKQIIDPIAQDQDLIYDMQVTSFHQKQKARMEQFKNSADPKVRAQYNDFSRMDIAFAEEDLKNAKRGDGSIRSVSPREFVPFEDVNEYLRKAAKESGVKVVTGGPDGKGYIIQQTNGVNAVKPFTEWAMATIGNRFDRQFQVMGRVTAEQAIRSEMQKSGVSRDQAIQNVASTLMPNIQKDVQGELDETDKTLVEINNKIAVYKNNFKDGFKTSDAQALQEYKQLLQQREEYTQQLNSKGLNLKTLSEQGSQYVANNLYSLLTDNAKKRTAYAWGATTAMATQEVDIKNDQAVITKWRLANQMQIAKMQINSREKIAAMQEQGQWERLVFNLKKNGKIPDEHLLGQFTTNTDMPAVNLLQRGITQNRNEAFNAAFGKGSLMSLVLDDNKQGEVYSALSKLKMISEGNNVRLTEAETKTLQGYARTVGTTFDPVSSAASATSELDNLMGFTYERASANAAVYKQNGRGAAPVGVWQNADSLITNFNNIIKDKEQLNGYYNNIADVIYRNGQLKEGYEKARIVGKTPQGKPIFDLSEVGQAQKVYLNSVIGGEYATRTRPVGTNVAFTGGLYPAEINALAELRPNMKITTEDGGKIDPALLNKLNYSDFNTLFGQQLEAGFDPASEKAYFKLRVSPGEGVAKTLGLDNAEVITVEIPYASISARRNALGRFDKYVQNNSVNVGSLGNLSGLATNPNGTVTGSGFLSNSGFDWKATGMYSADGKQYGVNVSMNVYNPALRKNQQFTQWIPADPSKPESFQAISDYLNGAMYQYNQSFSSWNQEDDDVIYLPDDDE